MPLKKSDLGRRTRSAQKQRRLRANKTEEQRALIREQNAPRMARLRAAETAEQRAARLEGDRRRKRSAARNKAAKKKKAELRAQQSLSTASNLPRSQQNKRNKRQVAQRRQRKICDVRQKRFRAQKSPDLIRLVIKRTPTVDYSSRHRVSIGTMTKVRPYGSAVEFNTESREMYCAAEKIKPGEPEQESADQRETLSRAQQSPDYNRFAIQCNSTDDSSLNQHNVETKGMGCTVGNIKLEEP